MEKELRYIRGLLIHIGLTITLLGQYLVSRDFKPENLIWLLLIGVAQFGIFLIAIRANFGKRG